MKLALAQINPVIGDLRHNAAVMLENVHAAHEHGAELVIFPELSITGYPPLDLLENDYFIEAVDALVDHIAREAPSDIGILLGAPTRRSSPTGKPLQNSAILLENGKRLATVAKTLLPTYDVFDEHRYFHPAESRKTVEWRGVKLGILICEDMWNAAYSLESTLVDYHRYDIDPVTELVEDGADILINLSASPFSVGKHERRNALLADICGRHGVPFVLVNQVGANTDIIYDGDSRVHAADGTRLKCAPSFEERLMMWDWKSDTAPCRRRHEDIEDLCNALTLGIRDYFNKTGIFSKAVLGLSGGIDSAVVCALAVRALGPDKVVGVTMPSRYSSAGSIDDSRILAENYGIDFLTVPIRDAVSAFESMLTEAFEGTEPDVTEENIQSRARGVTLMALSNKFNYLLLTTGNKSEVAVGYVTLYGDTNGGLAVLSDVYKRQVYDLARFINREAGHELIPESTITKPPSAELRPDQRDSDSLPPYEILDEILRLYIEERVERDAIVSQTGFDAAIVSRILRMVDNNEYKRRQTPPGLRVTNKAFGMGRRLPIVMRWNRDAVQEIISEQS